MYTRTPHVSTYRFIETSIIAHGGFGPEVVPAVRKMIDRCRLYFFKPGDHLIDQEDDGQQVYFVNHGVFKAMISDDNGNQTLLSLSFRGSLLGEVAALDSTLRSASVVAATDASVLKLGTFDAIARDLGTENTFRLLSRSACQRLRELTHLHEMIVTCTASEAIIRIIDDLAERSRASIDGCHDVLLPLTQVDISMMTGYRRETVNRAIKTAFGDSVAFTRSGIHIPADRTAQPDESSA